MTENGRMDFQEMRAIARTVNAQYVEKDIDRDGRAWTAEEVMLGFVADVGDLAKLVQGKAGVRPRENLDAALAHELADCLWSVLTLADAYDVDLEVAFPETMRELIHKDATRPAMTEVLEQIASRDQIRASEDDIRSFIDHDRR